MSMCIHIQTQKPEKNPPENLLPNQRLSKVNKTGNSGEQVGMRADIPDPLYFFLNFDSVGVFKY